MRRNCETSRSIDNALARHESSSAAAQLHSVRRNCASTRISISPLLCQRDGFQNGLSRVKGNRHAMASRLRADAGLASVGRAAAILSSSLDYASHLRDLGSGWRSKQATVFAAELRWTFVAHAVTRGGSVDAFGQHQAASLVQS